MMKFKLRCKKFLIICVLFTSYKIRLIKNIKHWWKLWSVRVYALIAISPDVYNAISSMGWLEEAPKAFVWIIRILALTGIITRLLHQAKLEQNHDNDINNNNSSDRDSILCVGSDKISEENSK